MSMRVKDAAEQLQVSDSLVYEWCRAGILRHDRYGKPGNRGTIRIEESDLLEFREKMRQQRQSK
jgi:excisionase family DNA binding protein